MLYLVTGTPGSGKTQYTLKQVTQDEHFKDRDVYTWGIPGLSPDLGWKEITDPEKWDSEVPNGAIVIIDEAHSVFPRLKIGSQKPPHFEPLSTHRHRGLDVFVITQYPNDLDIYVRGRVGWHYHLKRKMGYEASIVHKANEAFYPGDKDAMAKCETEVYKFDKKVWELYKSATVHNVQKKFPKKLLLLPVLLVLAIVTIFWAYSVLAKSIEDKMPETALEIVQDPSAAEGDSAAQSVVPQVHMTAIDQATYLRQYVPRVEGQPWTAPRYDDLMQARRAPKPAGCIHNKYTNVCRCITRDGSDLAVTREYCMGWMSGKFRFFDDTIPDTGYSSEPSSNNRLEDGKT